MSHSYRYDPEDPEGSVAAARKLAAAKGLNNAGNEAAPESERGDFVKVGWGGESNFANKAATRDGREIYVDPVTGQSYPKVRTFARRGDRMGETLERTFEKYRGAYLLDVSRGLTPTMVGDGWRLDTRVVFGREAPLIVEVGCGNGEQICAAAAANPDTNFLGFEVWLPGVAKAVSTAVRMYDGLPNLRITDLDAVQALPILFGLNDSNGVAAGAMLSGGAQVQELWTFFADPWPKARHRKRRLVGPEFARIVAGLLVDGGLWRLATDWDDYAWQQRDVIEATPGLVNDFAGQRPDSADPEGVRGGFCGRFEGRVLTAFERRAGREGRQVHDLCARRVERGSLAERDSLTKLPVIDVLGRSEALEKSSGSDWQ